MSGCAIVTPASCIYSRIYHIYHEIKTLIPRYKNNLLFFERFIDNMFSIWTPSDDPNAWENFKKNPRFGILEWEVEERKTSVDFLDLTISINKDHKIETRTYQKAINLYFYLPHRLNRCLLSKHCSPRLPYYFLTLRR